MTNPNWKVQRGERLVVVESDAMTKAEYDRQMANFTPPVRSRLRSLTETSGRVSHNKAPGQGFGS